MAEVRLSAAAAADLGSIYDFSVERFGADRAGTYLESFERAFDLLRRHPHAGALRLELNPPVRCLPHRSHLIFYDVDQAGVRVVRVLHHAMDATTWLSE